MLGVTLNSKIVALGLCIFMSIRWEALSDFCLFIYLFKYCYKFRHNGVILFSASCRTR